MDAVDTREILIAAAERHFGETGFDGASLREVMREAGVNPATAHYHFGSKRGIYEAVIARRLEQLCAERRKALPAILEADHSPEERVRALFAAYIGPHIRLAATGRGRAYSKLLVRFVLEDGEPKERLYREHIAPIRARYVEALRETAPAIAEDHLSRAFSFMVGLMATAAVDASYETMTGKSAQPRDPAHLIDQITDYCTAGFFALARGGG